MAEIEIPCVKLPELPKIPNITLFGGAQLNGFLDFSAGIPDQCGANFNLMAQLAPSLGSLTPMLKILAVVKALVDFITEMPANIAAAIAFNPDPLADAVTAVVEAFADLTPLLVALTPAGMAVTIKGILELILGILGCVIGQLESAVSFQAKIELGQVEAGLAAAGDVDLDLEVSAEVSAVLEASLSCAQANADLALEHAAASLGPIKPLLDRVDMLAGVAGLSLGLPSLEFSGGAAAADAVADLKAAVTGIEDVIKALPL